MMLQASVVAQPVGYELAGMVFVHPEEGDHSHRVNNVVMNKVQGPLEMFSLKGMIHSYYRILSEAQQEIC